MWRAKLLEEMSSISLTESSDVREARIAAVISEKSFLEQ